MPELEKSGKLTKARLFRFLDEHLGGQGVEYTIEGEEGSASFDILIDVPPEHFEDQRGQMEGLGSIGPTQFDEEVVLPIVRKINDSTNIRCEFTITPNNKCKISVSKKRR